MVAVLKSSEPTNPTGSMPAVDQRAQEPFNGVDTNGDGEIDADELDPGNAAEMIEEADKNGDGMVNVQQFAAVM